MKKIHSIGSIAIALSILLVCLLTSIQYHGFNIKYYEKAYVQEKTALSIGMSETGLMNATTTLLDYLQGKREDISCVETILGEEREVFNQRESDHMIDVLALYQNTVSIIWGFVGLSIAYVLYVIYEIKNKRISGLEYLRLLKFSFKQVTIAFVFVVACLGLYALMDFNAFWVGFHQIFFRNDLWMLDPRSSIMINMFPESFFFGMVIRITLSFVLSYGLVVGVLAWLQKKTKKKIELSK